MTRREFRQALVGLYEVMYWLFRGHWPYHEQDKER